MSDISKSHHAVNVTRLPAFSAFEGEAKFDVCVIGAGYTGISASIHLAELGYRVALVEAQRVGEGASGRNGGQLGFGMCGLQNDLLRRFDQTIAREFWNISVEAIELFHDLCAQHNIDCDYKSGIIACATSPENLAYLYQHADIVEGYGQNVYERLDQSATRHVTGSPIYCGAMLAQRAGHLNPFKYVLGLAKAAKFAGVEIFEQSRVTGVNLSKPVEVKFQSGRITAERLIFACNGHLGNLNKTLAKRILPVDNYQATTEVLDNETIGTLIKGGNCAWDTSHSVHYFRLTPDHRLTMGCGIGVPGYPPKNLESDCRKHIEYVYPQLKDIKIDYIWGGTLAGNMSKMPDVGRVMPHVLYAQGYSGHGLALAVLTGKYLAEELHHHSSGYKLLASVSQKNLPGGRLLRVPITQGYRLLTNTRDILAKRFT